MSIRLGRRTAARSRLRARITGHKRSTSRAPTDARRTASRSGGHRPGRPTARTLHSCGGGAIYRIGIDGQGRTRVVSGLVHPLVRWSPDGRKLLYTTGKNSGVDAWVVDVDGTHRRRVLHHEPIEGIAWRPGFG